jgi:hypothetical protein
LQVLFYLFYFYWVIIGNFIGGGEGEGADFWENIWDILSFSEPSKNFVMSLKNPGSKKPSKVPREPCQDSEIPTKNPGFQKNHSNILAKFHKIKKWYKIY